MSKYTDSEALRDRRATGCHYDVGLCECPAAPYEYEGCKAVLVSQLGRDHLRFFTLPGVDRDNAAAMFSQAAHSKSSRIDEIQVGHLLAIGWRAGVEAGRAQAAAEITKQEVREADHG